MAAQRPRSHPLTRRYPLGGRRALDEVEDGGWGARYPAVRPRSAARTGQGSGGRPVRRPGRPGVRDGPTKPGRARPAEPDPTGSAGGRRPSAQSRSSARRTRRMRRHPPSSARGTRRTRRMRRYPPSSARWTRRTGPMRRYPPVRRAGRAELAGSPEFGALDAPNSPGETLSPQFGAPRSEVMPPSTPLNRSHAPVNAQIEAHSARPLRSKRHFSRWGKRLQPGSVHSTRHDSVPRALMGT